MIEIWKPVPDYDGLYEVSDLGRVRSLHCEPARILIGRVDRYGYHTVLLSKSGCERRFKVHRLVCVAFNGPAPSSLYEVAHGDGYKVNNKADNLRWATQAENREDSIRHGTFRIVGAQSGNLHHGARLSDEDVEKIRHRALVLRHPQRAIARAFGISQPHVSKIASGKKWK